MDECEHSDYVEEGWRHIDEALGCEERPQDKPKDRRGSSGC